VWYCHFCYYNLRVSYIQSVAAHSAKYSSVVMLCNVLFCAGYITRFTFALSSSEDYHRTTESETRCCEDPHFADCKSCPCLCSSLHKQSTDDDRDTQSITNVHSLDYVYDDDGDIVVKRCKQFEVIYIGVYCVQYFVVQ